MNLIKYLSDNINADVSPELIGNKAYVLMHLYNRNFSLPYCFIITTEAFDFFLNSKLKKTRYILSKIKQDSDSLNEYLNIIQQDFFIQDMPADLTEKIYRAFDCLSSKMVAVRSSASIEDNERHSFAGQFESFLGVTKDNLLAKIKACWASLFSRRVLAYKHEQYGFGKMAVIIQQMIDADIAGVCFSIDPVSKDKDSIVIESVFGLGELLAQGAITPAHYVIDRQTLLIKEKSVNIEQQLEKLSLDYSAGGTKKYTLDLVSRRQNQLAEETIIQIGTLALKIEKLFNKPVDIEWALKGKNLYILQARLVTV